MEQKKSFLPEELVLSTRNKHKISEIREILQNFSIRILTLKDFPDMPPVAENHRSFQGNAMKKAYEVMLHTGKTAFADDSGLEVDVLMGEPGVFSSRYAGEDGNAAKNNALLLKRLARVPFEKRTAKFVCVIALISPHGMHFYVEGVCHGNIAIEPKGRNGFGYDPLFIPKGYHETFAELGREDKNKISHRTMALNEFVKKIREMYICD